MATNTFTYNGTASSFTGGVNSVAGQGSRYRATFSGTWVVGNGYTFDLVLPQITYTLGQGNVTGLVPTSCITLQDRVHFVSGIYWLGSDNGDPTAWEQQAAGAFKIGVAGQNQQNENLLALSPFQGKMMVASRNTIEIWSLNADPTQIAQQQVLSNIGVVSPFAVQSLGDFDVLFYSDSGIRSLRVMTINLNGFITDLGAPIDDLIRNEIAGQTSTQLAGICCVVEPTAKRFLSYAPNTATFYVLSYFPTAKIVAWSTFKGTMHGGVTFVPSVFRILNNVVFFRAVDNNGNGFIGSYGTKDGSTTNVYDDTQPIVELPWYDVKTPFERKNARGVDAVIQGQWTISGSMDFDGVTVNNEALVTIANQLNAANTTVYTSSQEGMLAWSDDGYHCILKAVADATTNPSSVKKLSQIVFYYQQKGQK